MATTKRSQNSGGTKAAKKKIKAKAKVSKKPAKTVKKASTKVAASKSRAKTPSAAVRQQMIEEMAYFNAQQRNFTPGNAMDDWLAAEAAVDKKLNKQ